MSEIDFDAAFRALTKSAPFPWQRALYERFISDRPGNIPTSATLPTGLGKTFVLAVWLIALAKQPDRIPRRLVYVVNRRTVVDQATRETEKIRANLAAAGLTEPLTKLCAVPADPPLAISTLRGQFADNREWSRDPARPAVIVGTVDMIGSRLLFGGYGCGFKTRPLHAGFLGQDALLVHDEAHLEKPFQDLIEDIQAEQTRCRDFRPFRVMALTATPRGGEEPFELTDEEKNAPDVIPEGNDPLHVAWRRLQAKKTLALTPVSDEKQVVPKIVELTHQRGQEHPDARVIIFVRTVEAVNEVRKGLRGRGIPEKNISSLTGTMRGLERSRQADPRFADADPVFARFLPPTKDDEVWKTKPQPGTVYLICTAAGEVGVDISADHLVCDLTPFDSMAQRFGRVNRYGTGDARIDVVHEAKPADKKKDDPFDQRRWLTRDLLRDLHGDASPHAIGQLPLADRAAAFTPTPIILPTSDILFDAWALTTIRDRLPGRPLVEPYLHGISEWEPPQTHVAWREEVGLITGDMLQQYKPADLLEDYPLKPHELLRDNSSRVFDRLKKLKAEADTPAWVVSEDDSVEVTTLAELIDAGKEEIERKTLLLPPAAGGLENGMFTGNPELADDVADELFDEKNKRRRLRVWDDDVAYEAKTEDMRLVRRIDLPAGDEDEEGRSWHWFELPKNGDTDGSKSSRDAITWRHHTKDVTANATQIADVLLKGRSDLHTALVLAAKFHDLGKKRVVWQRSIGNPNPTNWLAKSGGKMKPRELTTYRHEFGSLLDMLDKDEFKALEGKPELRDLVLHLIAVHHGYGRPHFPSDKAFDPDHGNTDGIAAELPRRYARLQRKYGRWGLAYLESLLRAADYAASAKPSPFVEEGE